MVLQQLDTVTAVTERTEIAEFKSDAALGEGKKAAALPPFGTVNVWKNRGRVLWFRLMVGTGVRDALDPIIYFIPGFQECDSLGDGDFAAILRTVLGESIKDIPTTPCLVLLTVFGNEFALFNFDFVQGG